MNEVYLGLGTNMGNRAENLATAIREITQSVGELMISSSVVETLPWGETNQNNYLNQVVMISTDLLPIHLLHALNKIEQKMGRVRIKKWGPRIIDIDILFYNREVIESAELTIPHPFLHERKFVLESMNEIAPDLIHPLLGKSMHELLAECKE